MVTTFRGRNLLLAVIIVYSRFSPKVFDGSGFPSPPCSGELQKATETSSINRNLPTTRPISQLARIPLSDPISSSTTCTIGAVVVTILCITLMRRSSTASPSADGGTVLYNPGTNCFSAVGGGTKFHEVEAHCSSGVGFGGLFCTFLECYRIFWLRCRFAPLVFV